MIRIASRAKFRTAIVLLGLAATSFGLGPAQQIPSPAAVAGSAERLLLNELPRLPDVDRMLFSVPISVLQQQVAAELRQGLPVESDAPVKAVLERWNAVLRPGDKDADIELSLRGNIFRAVPSDPVRLYLFPPDTVFKDVVVNGQPATPLRAQDGFFIEMTRPGPFDVAATLAFQPRKDGLTRSVRLVKDSYAVASMEVKSAEALEVRATGAPGKIVGKTDGGTVGTIAIGSTRDFSITWREALPEVEREATPSVTMSAAWFVGDKVLSVNALLEVEMMAGVLGQLAFALPTGADNVRLKGPDVRESRFEGGRADVFLKSRIAGRTVIDLSFDVPRQGKDTVSLPRMSVVNGRMVEGGWLLVGTEAGAELLEASISGLEPVSTLDVPARCLGLASSPPVHVYRQTAREAQATFDLVATSPFPMAETIVDRAEIVTGMSAGGEELTKITYTVRNNRGQFLRLRMPEGASLIHVAVEHVTCRASAEDGCLLVPMPRSVQTVDRLVSFPVEIVYCVQRPALSNRGKLALDLPELDGAPTALVNATMYYPENCRLGKAEGALEVVRREKPAGEKMHYGHAYSRPEAGRPSRPAGNATAMPAQPPAQYAPQSQPDLRANGPAQLSPEDDIQRDLADTYYDLGYQAYKENKLEDAESLLNKARELAVDEDSENNKNTALLLTNIKVARGEGTLGKLASDDKRDVQAKASQIRRNVSGMNVALEARQQVLLREGQKQLAEGREQEALEMLEEAQRVGGQLGQRGASLREQAAVARVITGSLDESKKTVEENKKLQKRLSSLQQEAQQIANAKPDAPVQRKQAEQLGAALIVHALEQNADVDELQDIVVNAEEPAQQSAQRAGGKVDEGVYASRYGKGAGMVNQAQKVPSAQPPQRDAQPQPSLREANVRMERQVTVLEKALAAAKDVSVTSTNAAAATPLFASWSFDDSGAREADVVRQIERARQKAEALSGELRTGRDDTSLDELRGSEKLKEIERTAEGVRNMYSTATNQVGVAMALRNLESSLEQARADASEAGQRASQATQISMAFDNVLPEVTAPASQTAWVRFFADNNSGVINAAPNGMSVWYANGNLMAANTLTNAIVLNDIMYNFRANAGNVVTTAGRNVAVPVLGDIPLLGRLFSTNTANGQRYAVLDEAQYRALMRSAAGDSQPTGPDGTPMPERDTRALIVGAPNRVAGQEVRVATAGADYNGYMVAGTEVKVPHSNYLALDNGGYVTILKGGAVRGWQEADPVPVVLKVEERFDLEVPRVGAAVRFTKTLLGAGESADMVMAYEYSK